MRPVALLALAAVAAAIPSGCLTDGGGEGSSPDASFAGECSGMDAAEATGNAPLVPALRGEPVDVAARFADAVGDPLASREPLGDRSQWPTESGGTVEVRVREMVSWWSGDGVSVMGEAEARAFLNATLTELGVDPSRVIVRNTNPAGPDLWFAQSFRGDVVEGTTGMLRGGVPSLTAYGLHDLSGAEPAVRAAEARETATAFARCQLDAEGRTAEAGYALEGVARTTWAVAHATLVHGVYVEFDEAEKSHCGLVVVVEVDAVTGDVIGWGYPPCD